MTSEEFAQWESDAKRALEARYTAEEIEVVIDWFRRIKGEDERELIGNDEVEAMLVFAGARENFDLYNCLMARLFIYAPLILRENGAVASVETFAKLMSDMNRFADDVSEQPGSYSKIRASRQFERLIRACRNVVTAGKEKAPTTEADFESLVGRFCDMASRPSHAVYAGDLQFLWSAEDKLRKAYTEAMAAATAN
jgi:hypothetical protein